MGQLVEQFAPEYGFDVPLRLDIDNNANGEGITASTFAASTRPSISPPRRRFRRISNVLPPLGVNAVIGTTGWLEQMDRVEAARGTERHRTGVESRTSPSA